MTSAFACRLCGWRNSPDANLCGHCGAYVGFADRAGQGELADGDAEDADTIQRRTGESEDDFRSRIRERFKERVRAMRPAILDSWPKFLESAQEAICGVEVLGGGLEITIYGASAEAQERLEQRRTMGQNITYRPMSEAAWMGLKPGEARLLSDD